MCICVHISVTKWHLMGYLPNALWNLWDGKIGMTSSLRILHGKFYAYYTVQCWQSYKHFLLMSPVRTTYGFNTLRPRQNSCRVADDTFKRIFLNENVRISIKISLKFVSKGPIYNIPALVQIMAWRRSGDKPLSEQMMVSLLMHIWVTRPQWFNAVSVTETAVL